MTKARSLCTCLLVAVALVTQFGGRAAFAQTTVDELIDQGVELRRQSRGQSPEVQHEKHSEALKLFQRAHAQEPSPRTLAQMGLAEQSLRRWLDAEAHLASALANDTFPWIIKNRGPLDQALQDVRRHIGQLVIRGTPSGANVYVNGQPRGTLPIPAPIRLPEGDATVQITAPGHQPHNAVVRIPPQGSEVIDVRMESAGAAGATTSMVQSPAGAQDTSIAASTSEGWSTRRILGVGLIGGALAGVATGVTLLAIHGSPPCSNLPSGAKCSNLRDTRALGIGFLAASGAVAAGGGLLVYQSARIKVAVALSPSTIAALGRF